MINNEERKTMENTIDPIGKELRESFDVVELPIDIVTIDKSIYWDHISKETQKILSKKEGGNTVEEFLTSSHYSNDIIDINWSTGKYYRNGHEISDESTSYVRHAVLSKYLQFKVPFKVGEDIDLKPYYIKAMQVFDYLVQEGMSHTKMFKQPFTVLIDDVKIQSAWNYLLKKGSYEWKELLDETSEVPAGSGIRAPILISEELSKEEQEEFDNIKNNKAVIIAIYFYNMRVLKDHHLYWLYY